MKQRKRMKQWDLPVAGRLDGVRHGRSDGGDGNDATTRFGRRTADELDLNGTWDFTPDPEAKAIVVRRRPGAGGVAACRAQ